MHISRIYALGIYTIHILARGYRLIYRGKDLLAYCASAEADINEFQPFKASGPDGLYPVLLQKGWNQLKGYYHVIFQACLRHSNVPLAWKEGTGIFLPKLGKESPYDHFNFFSTEMVGKACSVSY